MSPRNPRFEDAEPPEQAVVEAARSKDAARGRPRHDPIDPELLDDLHLAIGKALALVEIDEAARPDRIVSALADYVDRVIAGNEQLPEDAEAAVLALGCLYGQCLARAIGWGFRARALHAPARDRAGLPDTRYVVGPKAVVERALGEGGQSILDHFAKLRSPGVFPKSAPGKYLRLG